MTNTWTPPEVGEQLPPPTWVPAPPVPPNPAGPGLDRSDVAAPRPGRTLWVIFGSLLAVAGIGWGTFTLIDLLAHEEWVETATFPAAGIDAIEVDNENGRVEIVGTDTDEIRIRADVSTGLRDTGYSWELLDSTLRVAGTCPILGGTWCEVAYRIEVPSDIARLGVDGNNGSIVLTDIDGDVRLSTDNGRVEMSRLSGSVFARSDNGRIVGSELTSTAVDAESDNGRVELHFLEPPDTVIARSDNGRVEVVVPPVEDNYNVSLHSDNGSENLEIAHDPDSARVIVAESDNGSVTVRSTP